MHSPFVWFDNIGAERTKTTEFLAKTFDWPPQDIGPMILSTNEGDKPFAATCDAMPDVLGWIPYIEVADLSEETAKAVTNGARILPKIC